MLKPIAPPDVIGSGTGAGAGALAGIGGSIEGGGRDSFPGGLIVGILLAPVAGVVGAVAGAAMAHSEEDVTDAQAQLATVWWKVTPSASLVRAFIARSQEMGWRMLPADGGMALQVVLTTAGSAAAETPTTRLQIGVEALELVYQGKFDPDVHVMLRTIARFSTVADDTELFRANWTILREGESYFTYAERPQALRSKIDQTIAAAADAMTDFLFVRSSPVDAQQLSDGGAMVIEARVGALLPPAAASSGERAQATDQKPRQAPAAASSRPDGTIVLSPSVAAKLQSYLDRHPSKASYFYVSLDGQSAGDYVCTSNCSIELQAWDQSTKSVRAKQRAKSQCRTGAATECVMLFHQASAKQPYTTL